MDVVEADEAASLLPLGWSFRVNLDGVFIVDFAYSIFRLHHSI